jgi:Double zinc ribbon/Adenylate and Guanylate cyclase catalytic domain
MKCPRCQANNRDGARFCRECGATLATGCPSCGAKVEAESKFCDSCGAALAAAPLPPAEGSRFAAPETYTPKHLAEKILTSKTALEGKRKQVTVLFADLKGSMELLADRDPEEARELLDPVLERMMEAVHRFEGTVNQVMGDGIMALFGAPVAHEDHAVRACYAALRMQESVKKYVDEVRRSHAAVAPVRNLIGQPLRTTDTWRERPEPHPRRIECDRDYRVDGSRGLECGLLIPVRVDRTSGRRLARRPTTIRRRECSGDGVPRPEGWR